MPDISLLPILAHASRFHAMPHATERHPKQVTVTDGLGLIEVRTTGDGFAELFYINGKPITLSWSVSCGSILQNFIRTNHADLAEALEEFRDKIAQEFDPQESMTRQFQPVLRLLPNGSYRIVYVEAVNDPSTLDEFAWEAVEFDSTNLNLPEGHEGFPDYPLDPTMLCTVATAKLDQLRVSEFANAIDSGARPPIILLRASDGVWDLLIDGHHKLQAYRNNRLIPAYVRIEALAPSLVSHAEAGILIRDAPSATNYDECLQNWNRDTGFFGWAGTPRRISVGLVILVILLIITIAAWINL